MENQQANVSGVDRSVVSIGTAGAITNNVNAPARGDHTGNLPELLARLAGLLPELGLPPEAHAEVEAEIRTVEAQLGSPRPKRAIIDESLCTIRRLLEGVAGMPPTRSSSARSTSSSQGSAAGLLQTPPAAAAGPGRQNVHHRRT
jgi:hypothetical protein